LSLGTNLKYNTPYNFSYLRNDYKSYVKDYSTANGNGAVTNYNIFLFGIASDNFNTMLTENIGDDDTSSQYNQKIFFPPVLTSTANTTNNTNSSGPSIVQNSNNFQATDPKDGVTFTFPGTYKNDATSGFYFDIQNTKSGSDPLSNGKYGVWAALGVYGTTTTMANADTYIDEKVVLKIKKKGSSSYIGALERTSESNTTFSNGELINAGYSSWDNNISVDPGEYTVDFLLNGGIGDSLDICLPSFDPLGSVKPIGNVTCNGNNPTSGTLSGTPSDHSENTGNPQEHSTDPNALQTATAVTVAGITTIFKVSPEFIPVTGADSIHVNGFVRYEYYGTTEPSLKANRAGESVSVSLYDKTGKNIPGVGKVIPISSVTYNKDIPVNIVMPATLTGFNNKTSTAFTAADGPFKIKMADPGLGSVSDFLTVKTGSGNSVNTNQDPNPQTSNGVAADGSTVIFKMESVLLTTTTGSDNKEVSKIDFKGTITYEKAISSPTIKVNKLAGELYDDAGTKLRTMNVAFNSITPTTLGISGTFSNVSMIPVPATLKIWDKDSHAVSDGFTVEQVGGGGQVLMNGAQVPQTDAVLGKDGVNSVVFTIDPEYSNGKVSGTLRIEYKTKKPGTADSNISGGDVSVTLYNKSGAALKTINLGPVASGLVVFDQQSVPASFDFPSLNAADAPFTVKATEKNLNATSKVFSVPDAKVGGNNPDPDAEDDGEGTPPPSDNAKRTYLFNPLREGLDTIPKIVSALVKDIVIPIALPALALAIIWTGFLFVMARGNETKLTEAKRALKWTVIGGLIILGAYVIATALQQTLKDIVQ
jgi:hypothetical protein